MNFVGPNNLSLKKQRFIPSGYNDIGMRKFEVVAKTDFLKKLNGKYEEFKKHRQNMLKIRKICLIYGERVQITEEYVKIRRISSKYEE